MIATRQEVLADVCDLLVLTSRRDGAFSAIHNIALRYDTAEDFSDANDPAAQPVWSGLRGELEVPLAHFEGDQGDALGKEIMTEIERRFGTDCALDYDDVRGRRFFGWRASNVARTE